jgi:signal transduction histidine kinase/ligand-binding sensor domain-containing protein
MNASLSVSRWFGGLAALLLAATAAAAPPLSLGSYQHTAYPKQEGAPGDVSSIVQSADGFLWIVGTKGVTRYDGVTFQSFKPLAGEKFLAAQLNLAFPAEGGGIWIANPNAGPTLLKDGHLTHFDEEKSSAADVFHFFGDPQGGVWSVAVQGLMRFRGNTWEVIERSRPGRQILRGAFDADGTLWLVLREGKVIARARGSADFVDVAGVPEKSRIIFVGSSGRIYVSTATELHIYQVTGTTLTETTAPLPFKAADVVEDREGTVWITNTQRGVMLVSHDALRRAEAMHTAPVTELVNRQGGLTGSFAWRMWLDREGNLWVGTENGIDRFRRSAFTSMTLPDGLHEISAAVNAEGVLWIGSETHPLLRLATDATWSDTDIPALTMATYFDAAHDTVWAAGNDALWAIAKDQPTSIAAIGEGMVSAATQGVVADSKGRVYIGTNRKRHNVLVWDGHAWSDATTATIRPKVLAIDEHDRLWVGAAGEPRLARIDKGETLTFDERQGLQSGVIRSLYPEPGGLWIGGDAGIQHFDGKRFTTVSALDGDAFQDATGLTTDLDGNLWVQTLAGVREIEAADLAKALTAPATFVPYRAFDVTDGLPGAPDPDHTLPTLHRGSDGTLWAQTTSGLAWVDPKHIPQSRAVATVYIETVTSGESTFPRGKDGITLPAGRRSFRIAYTSPMFSRPERVKFRYRLVGFSDAWQDVGARREAEFTNVPPGRYRFEVKAISDTGAESSTADVGITRQPAYYETWWFRALGVVPLVVLLWVAYRLRTRTLTQRLRIRADEREAVARDIHDTLLQRFQGVMLTLQAWAMDGSIPGDRRAEMLEMSDQTRDALLEGRERILSLRRNEDNGLALYDQIAAEGGRLQAAEGMSFSLEVSGEPRALSSECQSELRDIAFEGLRNAFHHSHGKNVGLALDYAADALWLVITDDGTGFDEAVAKGRQDGHFGLLGLRERVARLAGTLSVESAPGEGTEVHIKLPARSAYAAFRRRWWH